MCHVITALKKLLNDIFLVDLFTFSDLNIKILHILELNRRSINNKTRMTTYINEIQESDDQTNINKYSVAANITEYHIISKSIFLLIIITEFRKIRQLCHVKMYVKF